MDDDKIEYWKTIIEASNKSPLSRKQWFKENNIRASTFYKWLKYFENIKEDKQKIKSFVPVDLKENNNQSSKGKISLEINGNIIRFDESILTKIVEALK